MMFRDRELSTLSETRRRETKRLEMLQAQRQRIEAQRNRLNEVLRQTDIAITATRSALDVIVSASIDDEALTLELDTLLA